MDNLESLTFTFFKLKVPNIKQFLQNIGTANMSIMIEHERELSRSKGRPGQREELCLELCQVVICVQRFETIGEYLSASCNRSGAFLEQVITTNFVTVDDFLAQRNISQAEH